MSQTLARTSTCTAVVCALLLLPAAPAALAQDPGGLEWRNLGEFEGIEIVRLGVETDPQFEHVLLRLTDERQKELMKNPGDFLNEYRVFSQPVQPLMTCLTAKRPDAPDDTSGLKWLVHVPHWPDSRGLCYAFLASFAP